MIPFHITIFDGLLNLIGAYGLWPAVYRLHRSDNLNPIEAVLKWILSVLFAFWSARFLWMSFSLKFLGPFVYCLAIAFAFCVCLYFEVLLRRHFPLWFKFYLTFGALLFSGIALTGNLVARIDNLIPFGAFIISLQLFLIFFAVTRTRSAYSKTENGTIDSSLVFLLILGPFFLTDVSSFNITDLPKLGVAAGLIFTYVSIYNQALLFDRGFLLKKLFKSVFTASFLALATYFLFESSAPMVFTRFFILFFCLHLIFRIHFAIYTLNGDDEMHKFVEYLNRANKKTILGFLQALREYYNPFDAILLNPADIPDQNEADIKRFFEQAKSVMVSRYEVAEWLNEKTNRWNSMELEAIEKIRDLLETHEKTHFCKMGTQRSYFVLFDCPFISYQKIIEAQTDLVVQVVALIESRDRSLDSLK